METKKQSKIKGQPVRLPETASDAAATPTQTDLDKAGKSIKSPLLKSLFNAKAKKEPDK